MFFALSKLIGGFLYPETILVLLILAGAIAAIARKTRLATMVQYMAAAMVVLFGILPGGTWLALPLEARFPADPPLPDPITGIVVLGGTERVEQTAAWGQPSFSDPGPIIALVALSQRYPDAKVVFTGGSRSERNGHISEAAVVHDFLDAIGVRIGDIVYEDRSRNTRENALFSRELVQPKPSDHWILVTDAISMPRAVAVFEKAGWNVIPFPAGYRSAGAPGASLSFDLLGDLDLAGVAIHEWVGLFVYRIMGYTETLFPG